MNYMKRCLIYFCQEILRHVNIQKQMYIHFKADENSEWTFFNSGQVECFFFVQTNLFGLIIFLLLDIVVKKLSHVGRTVFESEANENS